MNEQKKIAVATPKYRPFFWFLVWQAVFLACQAADHLLPLFRSGEPAGRLPSGITILGLISYVALLLSIFNLFAAYTRWRFMRRQKPDSESVMIGRLYTMGAVIGALLMVAYGFGKLGAFGQFFALFGGMLLGWSLQAPVSGFAAWILVSFKRPFRPGDRIQFPTLNLVGDVKDIGAMYTTLDQVGGTIGSEEAVGRYILVPNAMLFNQVVINYTVKQEAAFMLDEVVIRITYDSNWDQAEKILIDAATQETADIIEASGINPYIRSDWYDYGVYLRLRYQTRVQERAEIAYRIQKRIFEDIQRTPTVDMAIPYVYSYRAGLDRKEDESPRSSEPVDSVQSIPIELVSTPPVPADSRAVQALAQSIAREGLLQAILVAPRPDATGYELLAGDLRLAACRSLGWKTIPAIVRQTAHTPPPPPAPKRPQA